MPRHVVDAHEVGCALALVPFGVLAVATTEDVFTRCVASVVVINGLACHLFGFVQWDVMCNALLIGMVNRRSVHQPWTFVCTAIAVVNWITSCCVSKPIKTAIHIVGVTCVFWIALCTHVD